VLVCGMLLGLVAPSIAQSAPLPGLTVAKTQYFVISEPPLFGCGDPLMVKYWQLTVGNI
jgi:hypothetical protein